MAPYADAPAWATALEASRLGATMRGSFVLYPIANLGHVFGLLLFAGCLIVLDLRLLGAWRHRIDAAALAAALAPLLITGFLLLVTTGMLLLSADARPLTANPAFQTKAVLLGLALANAIAFQSLWRGHLQSWDETAPFPARLQVAGSLALWLMVAAAGRLIGYL
jgi:hypothetical protein